MVTIHTSGAMAEYGGEVHGGWQPGDPDRRERDIGPPVDVAEERRANLNMFPPTEEMNLAQTPSSPDDVWPAPDDPTTSAEYLAFNPEGYTATQLRDGTPTIRELAVLPGRSAAKYECFATDDPKLISDARRMTAQYYLKRGFITPDVLDEEGRIAEQHDPYLSHSRYFVYVHTETGQLVACCRKIYYDPEKGEKSFPLLDHKNQLDGKYQERIANTGLENIVELSALVKDPKLDTDGQAVFKLYRKLVQDAWDKDKEGKDETFIMACNPKLYTRLRWAFDGIIHRLGPDLDYPGQEAVPAMFSTRQGAFEYIKKSNSMVNPRAFFYRRVLKFMLATANTADMDEGIVQALRENGYGKYLRDAQNNLVPDTQSPVLASDAEGRVKKLWRERKPEVIAAATLLGWTAVRTAVVATEVSPTTDVDWRIFLLIELATEWPYAKNMGTVIRGIHDPEKFTLKERRKAAAKSVGYFVAPYAYIMKEGQDLPPSVWGGIAAFIGVGAYNVTMKVRRARREAMESQKATPALPEAE